MNHRLRLLVGQGVALTLSLGLWTAFAYGQSNSEIVDAVRRGNLTGLVQLLDPSNTCWNGIQNKHLLVVGPGTIAPSWIDGDY